MHTIRKFDYTDSDYQALANLFEDISGNYHHQAEDIQHMDQIRGPAIPFARFVVEADGKMIAACTYGQSIWFASLDKLHLTLDVHPDHPWQELADAMYNHLVAQASEHNPDTLAVRIGENDAQYIHFWESYGFERVAREPRFVLDLTKFDPVPYAAAISEGIQIISLAKLQSNDPDWEYKWWQMEWLILQDLATDEEPAVRRTFAQFKQDIRHPVIIPQAFFFVVDGDQYVAISGLTRYDELAYLADLTWAIPSHQARGLELALKLKTIKWAQKQGATYIIDEALEDDPIYEINLNLGFEHLPAWLVYEKHL